MKLNYRSMSLLKSESGSAIMMALVAVALLGLMASATLTVSSLMNSDAKRKSQTKAVNHFIRSLEAIASNQLACMGAGTGQNRVSGLRFNPQNRVNGNLNQSCDSACIDMGRGTRQLPVALDTIFSDEARVGKQFNDLGLRVDQIYLTDVTDVGNPNIHSAKLMVQVSSLDPVIGFAPREVGVMQLQFDAGRTLVSCNASPSARGLCESMDCVFNPKAPIGRQRCNCSFPELACAQGSYVSGVDAFGKAICTPVQLNCAVTHGDGYFFAGVDHQGQPICLAVEGTLGAPPQ